MKLIHLMILTLLSITLFISSNFAFAQASLSHPVLLSEGDARKFCLEDWFPLLQLGKDFNLGNLHEKLDALLEIYTDDIEFIDPNNQSHFGKPVLKGKSDVRRYHAAVLPKYPEWSFEILAIYPTSTGFILRYRGHNAPPVQEFEGVDIVDLRFELGRWKMSRLIGYYDRLPFVSK